MEESEKILGREEPHTANTRRGALQNQGTVTTVTTLRKSGLPVISKDLKVLTGEEEIKENPYSNWQRMMAPCRVGVVTRASQLQSDGRHPMLTENEQEKNTRDGERY